MLIVEPAPLQLQYYAIMSNHYGNVTPITQLSEATPHISPDSQQQG